MGIPIPLITAGIGAGGNILSSLMGRGENRKLRRALMENLDFSKDVYREGEERAQPFRDVLYPQILSTLQDPSSITGTPAYGATIGPLGESFNTFRSQARENLPRGGLQEELTAQSYSEEARTKSKVLADLYGRYEGIGLNLAKGVSPESAMQLGVQGANVIGGQIQQPDYSGLESSLGTFGSELFNYFNPSTKNLPVGKGELAAKNFSLS